MKLDVQGADKIAALPFPLPINSRHVDVVGTETQTNLTTAE